MNNKGIVFSLDSIFALIIISMLFFVFFSVTTNEIEELTNLYVSQKISDLLITSQFLEIDYLSQLEDNYNKLLPNVPGYIKINSSQRYLHFSKSNSYKKLISQNITYVNSFGKEVYLEIGVYS